MTFFLPLLALLQTVSGSELPGACDRRSLECAAPIELQQSGAARDAWIAEDKLRHFFASFAATGFSFGAARSMGLDRDGALPVAAVAAATLGLWKEFRDRGQGHGFSARDLVWDGAGILLGIVFVRQAR